MSQIFTTTFGSAAAVGLYWHGSVAEVLSVAHAMGQWLDMWLPV